MNASMALQKALYETLAADAALTLLLGPGKVFDKVPRDTSPPFIRFAGHAAADFGAAGVEGEEHALELEVWSAADGRRQAGEIAAAAAIAIGALAGLDPPFLLANLELRETRCDAVSAAGHYRVTLRLRAVTETAP